MLLGALVAGLHAGLIYNTWPTWMAAYSGQRVCASPWWINFFENPGTAQFDHRIGAYLWWPQCGSLWWADAGQNSPPLHGAAGNALLHITLFQIVLGIATLLMQAPEFLAAAHQVTAALLFCAAVWHAYELRHADSA